MKTRPKPPSRSLENDRLYLEFRQKVVPWLRTFPSQRIWLSEGSEVDLYMLSILLEEEGLSRCRVYVTHSNELDLMRLKRGVYRSSRLGKFERSYLRSGGCYAFKDYYSLHSDKFSFCSVLKKNILFFSYNLKTDESFNEFHVILYRRELDSLGESKASALEVMDRSLRAFGVLGVDSLPETEYGSRYRQLAKGVGIYKRVL